MTTTLRIDDDLKRDCDKVFEELGLNMTSALTVFLKQVVRTRTIPFIIGEYQTPAAPSSRKLDGQRAWEIFERCRLERIAKDEREWTMDEINEEIAAARRESANKAKAACS